MHILLAVIGAFTAGAIVTDTAWADGSLPPQPYNYLHPPAALASVNSRPTSGSHAFPVTSSHSLAGFVFTADGQAGVSAPANAFRVSSSDRAVLLQIKPVDIPSALASGTLTDGNTYSITAEAQPGGQKVGLAGKVNLTLRWPRTPAGIQVYAGHVWKQVCSTRNATVTSSTITCPINMLGVFQAVTNAKALATRPTSLPYLIAGVITVIALIAVSIYLAYELIRNRARTE